MDTHAVIDPWGCPNLGSGSKFLSSKFLSPNFLRSKFLSPKFLKFKVPKFKVPNGSKFLTVQSS